MFAQFSIIALDILLLATLVYLFVLMRKLKILSSHRDDMRSIINDVIVATESSRDAVARLKSAVIESQNSMANYFEDARKIQSDFDKRMTDANKILADFESFRGENQSSKATPDIRNQGKSPNYGMRSDKEIGDLPHMASKKHPDEENGRLSVRDQNDVHDRDVRNRLASIHESVSHLRSKIMAHS